LETSLGLKEMEQTNCHMKTLSFAICIDCSASKIEKKSWQQF